MTLSSLLLDITQLQPGLNGRVGLAHPDEMAPAAPCDQRIARLVAYWQQRYPQAGPLYWASRSWSMLIWQPLYLAMWSAQYFARVPCMQQLKLSLQDGWVSGFCLPEQPLPAMAPTEAITLAAEQTAPLCQALYQALSSQIRLHPKMARRLQADCLLSALIAVVKALPAWHARQVDAWAQQWLTAAGLAGQSALQTLELPQGAMGLALKRQVCCQYFRCQEGELCSSCPRLPAEQGQQRMREAWLC